MTIRTITTTVTRRAKPADGCDHRQGPFSMDRGCQRRGAYRLRGACRGNFCLQHAQIRLGRPLTDDERA